MVSSIIIGIICLLLGVGIAYFIFNDNNKLVQIESKFEEERQKTLADLEAHKQKISSEYKTLLSQAKDKNSELENRLLNVINENVDDEVKEQLAAASKLKSQIKKLQDDIEDYEDDLSSLKKKLLSSKSENEELIEKINMYRSENDELSTSLSDIQEKLSENVDELNLKIDSLDFIQEILSAEEVHKEDENVQRRHAMIDSILDIMRTDIREIMAEEEVSQKDKDKYFGEALTKWSITAKKEWVKNKTSIAFVGEFSAGKTSIVNRILSQDDPDIPRLPVSTKATTAIPTYITGNENVSYTDYQFVTPTNIQKRISEQTFKKVDKHVLEQVKGVSNLIQYFVMTYQNPNLSNLSILDTPGFSSNDKEDAERTIEVINECDALFWVFDVNSGTVNRTSIELIKNNLRKPLYVVINKVDTKSVSEVDDVEKLIKKTLHDAGLSVKSFIRFSANTDLADIMVPIFRVEPDKSLKNYWSELLSFLDTYQSSQRSLLSKLKQEDKNYEQAMEDDIDKYVNELKAIQQKCQTVYSIPQYTEHFFSNDRYEFSKEDGEKMQQELNGIIQTPEVLGHLFDTCIQSAEEWNTVRLQIAILKTDLKRLESSIDKINKNYKIYKS